MKRTPADFSKEAPRQFATTRWSLVLQARSDRGAVQHSPALADLCHVYYFPIYAYLRKQSRSAEAALDLTQEFFLELLDGSLLDAVAPERGRFRAFLLAAARNFFLNAIDRQNALKRGGGRRIVPLDSEELESRYLSQVSDTQTPDREFDRQWALTVLETALVRLEQSAIQTGKQQQFDVLRNALTMDRDYFDYEAAADLLGLQPDHVRTLVHRLRKQYRQTLRYTIAETLSSADEIEAELQELFSALSPR